MQHEYMCAYSESLYLHTSPLSRVVDDIFNPHHWIDKNTVPVDHERIRKKSSFAIIKPAILSEVLESNADAGDKLCRIEV